MLALLGDSEYRRYTYKYEHPIGPLGRQPERPHAAAGEYATTTFSSSSPTTRWTSTASSRLMASADTSLTSRGRTAPRFVVLGNTRWNRYNNRRPRDVLQEPRRSSSRPTTPSATREIRAGVRPTPTSVRSARCRRSTPTGATTRPMIFAPAMYGDIEYDLEDRRYTPLQTTYRFGQGEGSARTTSTATGRGSTTTATSR